MNEVASYRRNLGFRKESVSCLSHLLCNRPLPAFINPTAIPSRRRTRSYICRRPSVFHKLPQIPRKWAIRPNGHVLNASALTSQSIDAGSYLHVLSGSRLRLTRALRPEGKRSWMVQDASGTEFSVPSKQILFVVGPPSETALSEDLSSVESLIEARVDENEELLEVAWEELSSQDGPFSMRDICQVLFTDEAPLSMLSTHVMLVNDDVYFKARNIKGSFVYEARTPEVVKNIQAQKLEQFRRYQLENAKREDLQRAYETRSLEPLKRNFSEIEIDLLLSSLREIAIELGTGKNNIDSRYAFTGENKFSALDMKAKALVQLTMSALSKPVIPSSAFDVLVAWKQMARHENLIILRAELDTRRRFPEQIHEAADALLSHPPEDIDRCERKDLRHLQAFAIDSSDTTEIDDAIAFDSESNCVYVHVADPSRYFEDTESDLLREALRRSATVYLPTEKLTMFPEKLANELFSLTGKRWDGTALSFQFQIAEDGTIVKESTRVQPTLISKALRLTYEEADNALNDPDDENHDALTALQEIAERRREWREMEGGAIMINNPFPSVEVTGAELDVPDIKLGIVKSDTPAWMLVSELMITACTTGAWFAKEAGIPIPYRSQEPFDYPDDDIIDAIPDGPARAAVVFRNAAPSVTSMYPNEHASLGVDYYTQLTSPIRRSLDLITHFQLKAFIRGQELPFSVQQIQGEIARSQEVGRDARLTENKSKRYWQLEYLRRLGPEARHRAIFVRCLKDNDDRVGFAHLEDYGFQVVVSVPPGLKPAAPISVRVSQVNPRMSVVQAESVLHVDEGSDRLFSEDVGGMLSDVTADDDLV
ncbi:hypothetical protein BWQ96_04571 [Gracilariopsis chorda]|uniref:RNB domain-containing protein n=1 Tax=Gracilariopsis chorda TaxID=448386 RepID=A0A2V3IVD4_9FLOR|nr:hypothetical protein BWQ96_04571 [Gracilariopsis chorda]|eukprot:PXF45667.1 hypothetical protein BWQ96_04571 [Gracilariopsis chorda]